MVPVSRRLLAMEWEHHLLGRSSNHILLRQLLYTQELAPIHLVENKQDLLRIPNHHHCEQKK